MTGREVPMTDATPKWTDQQGLAIGTTGRDVLVTASAGTGKTAVLSQRCVRILADSSDMTDASEILVMTFTEAAAEEMRSRIAQKLQAQYTATRDRRLKYQLLMLDAANISTIHSFCKRLITENFDRLKIDPAFKILAPDEQSLLKSHILDEIIEEAWADPALAQGLGKLLDRRNISGGVGNFLKMIISISEFLDSLPCRTDFFQRARALTDMAGSAARRIAQEQKQIIINKLTECRSQFKYSQFLDRQFIEGGFWSEQIEDDFIKPVDVCIDLLENGDIETCAETLLNHITSKFKRRSKEISAETADLIKEPAKKAIDTFKSLGDYALINPDYAEIVTGAANLQSKVLIELVGRFDRKYTEAKRNVNCLDFADLEHLAFELLADNPDVAGKLQRQFKYIFIDEYQDINTLQQEIISKVSLGGNVFVVGDIKQSIYGFRQSRPEIFLARLADSVDDVDQSGIALRVDLSDNFRSRKGILDFANAVFKRIMKSTVATIDYNEKAYLKNGFKYDPFDGNLVEMYILNEDSDSDSENSLTEVINPVQRQAAFITKRIKKMVGFGGGAAEFKIYDRQTDSSRDVEYRDIVILMRSPARRANEYVEVLRLGDVPVNSQSAAGYFATTEITDCICLLKVLDNPRQDIDFASALRSPFFKVTDSELAMIRANSESNRNSFYDDVKQYIESGPDESLRKKLNDIIADLKRWQKAVRSESLADLLWRVFCEKDYLPFVSALPNGKQRKANLHKLHDRAIGFEGFAGSKTSSVSRFVEYVEKLLDADQDWAPAAPETSADNAVRIMSIHKSKGLEFPVVFLAEMNSRFNRKDSYSDCLVDDAETIGLRIIEPHSKVKLSNMAHQVIAEKKLDMTIAEEMRLLYVAVTRARERLILTASRTQNNCTGILAGCSVMGDEPLRDWQLKSAGCHFDWLMYAFGNNRKVLELFGIEGGSDGGDLFSAELIDRDALDRISAAIMTKRQGLLKTSLKAPKPGAVSKEAKELLQKVKISVNWKYPYIDATKIAAKQSVSDLTHAADEFAKSDFSTALGRKPKVLAVDRTGKAGGMVLGSATHLVIQNIDLTIPVTLESIGKTADKLTADGMISSHIKDKIDFSSIQSFFESDLGRLVLANTDHVKREWPFTFSVNEHALGEPVVVQGIVDMIISTSDGLVVVDFKTDNVTTAGLEDRAAAYTKQICYYSRAVGSIFQQEVSSAWLYFLKCGCSKQVPINRRALGG